MASSTRGAWVWVNSGSWWWTGRGLACCDSWGRKESDTTERLNWTERINMSPCSWNSFPTPTPSHFSRLSQDVWFELSVSLSKFPLAVYFAFSNVYVSTPLHQFIPCSPSHIEKPHTYRAIKEKKKETHIWISPNEVDEHTACYMEWSKSEGEEQILSINAHTWSPERWYWWTIHRAAGEKQAGWMFKFWRVPSDY